MRYMTLALSISLLFSQELEVEGNLKVQGEIDASEQRIKNVAEPALSSDAATAYYVDERTAGKGRIITLKCPWHVYGYGNEYTGLGSCEVPACPDGWSSLVDMNETTGVTYASGYTHVVGNSVRYCMEDEE